MREIKFRGKRKDNNQMIYGDLCAYDHMVFIGVAKTIFQIRKGVFVPNVIWYEVLPESIGQFSDLKDKNRKEIYEGDIFDSPSKNKFKVIFDNGCFYYQNIVDEHPIGLLKEVAEDWKIIGNIYENLELEK